jgi:hypothetical protein
VKIATKEFGVEVKAEKIKQAYAQEKIQNLFCDQKPIKK